MCCGKPKTKKPKRKPHQVPPTSSPPQPNSDDSPAVSQKVYHEVSDKTESRQKPAPVVRPLEQIDQTTKTKEIANARFEPKAKKEPLAMFTVSGDCDVFVE